MAKLRDGWSRTVVVKLEGNQRETVSVGDLLALAEVLDVPPVLLIADPRQPDEIPVSKTSTMDPWDALLWLIGARDRSRRGATNRDGSSLIYEGWTVAELVFALDGGWDEYPVANTADEITEGAKRALERQRPIVERLRDVLGRMVQAGYPLPPMPDWVYRRADELDVELPHPTGES